MNNAHSHPEEPGFRPLCDNILVRRSMAEPTTPGGIMIPDTARAPVDRGIVVAVGPGRRTQAGTLIPLAVTPGDEVMLARGSGTDVTLDGEQFVVVHERDVLGVLVPQVPQVRSEPGADVLAESILAPAHELGGTRRKESLETDVAPDLLDREAPTGDDLH